MEDSKVVLEDGYHRVGRSKLDFEISIMLFHEALP